MEIYHDQRNEVAWSSWLPALGYALGASTGPVLEIGVGHFSTPFLHEYCKAAGRELWSVEADPVWRKEFDDRYGGDFHRFGYPMKGISSEMFTDKNFGVVFIDNSPGGQARLEPFIGYRNKATFLVVHDYWRDNEEAIGPFLKGMNYEIYRDYEPPTLIASYKSNL